MKSNLKIAFVTSADPRDRRTFSGTFYQMLEALKLNFSEVVPIGPIKVHKLVRIVSRLSQLIIEKVSSGRYHTGHSLLLSRYYGYRIQRKLENKKFDLIFAPVASAEIAFLKTDTPVFYFADSSFNQMKDYYDHFSDLSKIGIKESNLIEKKALSNSGTVIHASKWASEYVAHYYKVRADKLFTVPMGANIDEAPPMDSLEQKLAERKICNLLFIGVEWERKGGEIAIETFLELERLGLKTRLVICGCIPPHGFTHPGIRVIPFLDKNDAGQYRQFLDLYVHAHFLIVPTRAECQGVVFCEASAYGVPSITTDTGGIPSAVENGVNGYRLDLNARGPEYAQLIREIFENADRYEQLVYQSRLKYDTELNWQSWGRSVSSIIESRMSQMY